MFKHLGKILNTGNCLIYYKNINAYFSVLKKSSEIVKTWFFWGHLLTYNFLTKVHWAPAFVNPVLFLVKLASLI